VSRRGGGKEGRREGGKEGRREGGKEGGREGWDREEGKVRKMRRWRENGGLDIQWALLSEKEICCNCKNTKLGCIDNICAPVPGPVPVTVPVPCPGPGE
jgi:hypothetical protein